MTKWGAFAGMVTGAVTVIVWADILKLSGTLYEIIPGFAASLLAIIIISLLTKPAQETRERFDKFTEKMKD
jgi:sodium/proline symporter